MLSTSCCSRGTQGQLARFASTPQPLPAQRPTLTRAVSDKLSTNTASSFCQFCRQPVTSGRQHTSCRASRPHQANAAAVQAVGATDVAAPPVEIVSGDVVDRSSYSAEDLRRMERMFNMSTGEDRPYDDDTRRAESLIDDLERCAQEAKSATDAASDLPDVMDEFQSLALAVRRADRQANGQTRDERQLSRSAKRASHQPQAAAAAKPRTPATRKAAPRARTVRTPAQAATTSASSRSTRGANRQSSEPSTSSPSPASPSSTPFSGSGPKLGAPTGRRIASTRRQRSSQWGRSAALAEAPAEGGTRAAQPSGMLRNLTATKLLTGDQEKVLATRVQQHLKLEARFNALRTRLGAEPTMDQFAASLGSGVSVSEVASVLDQGAVCKHAMVQANTRLVVSVAKRYTSRGIPISDLVAEGIHGLIRAVEKFDPTKGFKFSTYAHWWIRQAMTRAIAQQSRVVRLPAHLTDLAAGVMRTRTELAERLERDPTDAELAAAAGVTVKRLKHLMLAYRNTLSLNAPSVSGEPNSSMEDTVEDSHPHSVDAQIIQSTMTHELEAILDSLDPREAAILRMRYGLRGQKGSTLEHVGQSLHVTRERIRQIESKALRKLRVLNRRSGDTLLEQYDDDEVLECVSPRGRV